MKKYYDLFMAFMRCGIFGFGGGQATVPLIQEEIVEKYKWLTVEEFIDTLALAQTLPGPMTTKMATFAGYKVGGIIGAVVSIIGIVIPSAFAILMLGQFYLKHKDDTWMQGMMIGVRPVIVVLIAKVVFVMSKSSFPNSYTVIIALIALIAIFKFDIHPILLIVVSMVIGGVFLK